jgi:hypothetical protein
MVDVPIPEHWTCHRSAQPSGNSKLQVPTSNVEQELPNGHPERKRGISHKFTASRESICVINDRL